MKKLFDTHVELRDSQNAEKYRAFVQRNRELRVDIKCILCEDRENDRRIDELKRSMNTFGTGVESDPPKGKAASRAGSNQTKRELIKFRDYLLSENDKLLFEMNKMLI